MPPTLTLNGVSFFAHDEIPHEEGLLVDSGLVEANERFAPLHEVRRLSCFARMAPDKVVGGAVGRRWGVCCELQQLWVNPEYRRRGIGSQLIHEFERVAINRGCRTCYLETFSFQAPSLYLSLGYQVRLELHGFSPGVVKYTMIRELIAGETGA